MKPYSGKVPLNDGYTLTELTVLIAISASLVHFAVPSFSQLIGSIQLGTSARQFLTHYSLAKTTALQRNTRTHLCASDGLECSESGQWNSGWILFTDDNENLQAEAEEILRVARPLPQGYTFTSNTGTTHLVFSTNGRATKLNGSLPLMTFRICNKTAKPETMDRHSREIVINGAGRARLQYGRNHITRCE